MEDDRQKVGRHGGRRSSAEQARYMEEYGKAMARAYDPNRDPPFQPDEDWVYDPKFKIYRFSPKNRNKDAKESPQNLTQANIEPVLQKKVRQVLQ